MKTLMRATHGQGVGAAHDGLGGCAVNEKSAIHHNGSRSFFAWGD